MSSGSIAVLQQEVIGVYISGSANVLFLFDCLITLSQEIDVLWGRKWTATTWLYMLTRYNTVIRQIILDIPLWTDMSIQYLCLAWFSSLRVYALLLGNKYLIASMVLLLNLVPFATNMFNYTTSILIDGFGTCTAFSTMSQDLLIFDVLVLAVTWAKTAEAYQQARRLKIKSPLVTVLFRNGTIYFLILLVINILEVVQENFAVLITLEVVEPFFNIIPSMIVCHFILSLRQIEPTGASWPSADQSQSLRFVGNMGQSLQFGQDTESGEGEDVPGVRVPPNRTEIFGIVTEGAEGEEVDGKHIRRRYSTDLEAQQLEGPAY